MHVVDWGAPLAPSSSPSTLAHTLPDVVYILFASHLGFEIIIFKNHTFYFFWYFFIPQPPQLPPKPAGSLRSSNERLQCAEEYTPALPPREGSLKRAKKKVDPVQPSTTAILYNTPTTKYNTEWNGMCIPMLGKLPSNFLR